MMFLAELFRPYIRAEAPGWGKIAKCLHITGYREDPRWSQAPRKVCRGKFHHYLMRCDLRNWSQRLTYFLGRFYELDTQLLMMKYIRPGDRVIDIGANVGMISLLMSRLVGDNGRVESCEPNPACCAEIDWLIEANALRNITLHRNGLGDAPATLKLTLRTSHTGTGTLASIPQSELTEAGTTIEVPVKVGDDLFLKDERPVAAIKIDVEGFECHVLDGLTGTINRWHPMVITEMDAGHLKYAGATVEMLAEKMTRAGYKGYGIHPRRRGLGYELVVTPLTPQTYHEVGDGLWLHPDNPRTAELLASSAK
jgi:FkbM family methyltransferase